MALSGLYGSNLTATSNPAPGTAPFLILNPFAVPYIDRRTVSTDWTNQGIKCLIPRMARNQNGEVPIPVQFIPGGGAATTYQILLWQLGSASKAWSPYADGNPLNFTGPGSTRLELAGSDPVYIQIVSLSSGGLGIYFDNGLAEVL